MARDKLMLLVGLVGVGLLIYGAKFGIRMDVTTKYCVTALIYAYITTTPGLTLK